MPVEFRVLAELLAVVPRSLILAHGEPFGAATAVLPLPLPAIQVCALAPVAALRDASVEWFTNAIARAAPNAPRRSRGARARS